MGDSRADLIWHAEYQIAHTSDAIHAATWRGVVAAVCFVWNRRFERGCILKGHEASLQCDLAVHWMKSAQSFAF